MKNPSPDPSYSSTESMVAGKVMAERMTPALAASDLSVPVFTPLVMELETVLLLPILIFLPIFLIYVEMDALYLSSLFSYLNTNNFYCNIYHAPF